jgi:aminoglycoside phosphotransferase (APT) family kinase protein
MMRNESLKNLSADEQNLKAAIEQLTGGKLVEINKQIRWRPAWFCKVECEGDILKIYVRGDRQSDVMPFENILEREAKILQVLEKNRIPVPHVYGMCEDPKAIIMEDIPGTRDVSTAKTDQHRQRVARQYMDALAKMHQIPLQEFADIGLEIPETAEEIALAGIHAYRHLYDRVKIKPDPLLEFSIRWLRDNVPQSRTRAGFIQYDAGQFLFDDTGMTALYDFEFGLIGEPLCDLGTMGGRHSVEPMGDSIPNLSRYYESVSGNTVDPWVVHYQQAVFLTGANMQFAGCVQNPQPGDPHDVYTEWDKGMRHNLILALAACIGVELQEPAAMTTDPQPSDDFLMLSDLVSQLKVAGDEQQSAKSAVQRMVEFMAAKDRFHQSLKQRYHQDAVDLLKYTPDVAEDIDKHLEEFVSNADADRDREIIQFFYQNSRRLIQAVGETALGGYAANVRLELVQ